MKTAEEILEFVEELRSHHLRDYEAARTAKVPMDHLLREVIQVNLLDYVIQNITEEADDEQEG